MTEYLHDTRKRIILAPFPFHIVDLTQGKIIKLAGGIPLLEIERPLAHVKGDEGLARRVDCQLARLRLALAIDTLEA